MNGYDRLIQNNSVRLEDILLAYDDEEAGRVIGDIRKKYPNVQFRYKSDTVRRTYGDDADAMLGKIKSMGWSEYEDAYTPLSIEELKKSTDEGTIGSVLKRAARLGYPVQVNETTVRADYGDRADEIIAKFNKRGWSVIPDKPPAPVAPVATPQQQPVQPMQPKLVPPKPQFATAKPTAGALPIEGVKLGGISLDPFAPQYQSVSQKPLVINEEPTLQERMSAKYDPAVIARDRFTAMQKDAEGREDIDRIINWIAAPVQVAAAPFSQLHEYSEERSLPGIVQGLVATAVLPMEALAGATDPQAWADVLRSTTFTKVADEVARKKLVHGADYSLTWDDWAEVAGKALEPSARLAAGILGASPAFVQGAAMFELADGLIKQAQQVAGMTGPVDLQVKEGKVGTGASATDIRERPLGGTIQGVGIGLDMAFRKAGFPAEFSQQMGNLLGVGLVMGAHRGLKRSVAKMQDKVIRKEMENDLSKRLGFKVRIEDVEAKANERMAELEVGAEQAKKYIEQVVEWAGREIKTPEELQRYTAELERTRQADPIGYEADKFSRMSEEMQVAKLESAVNREGEAKIGELERFVERQAREDAEATEALQLANEAFRRADEVKQQEVQRAEGIGEKIEGAGPQEGLEGQAGGRASLRDIAENRMEAQEAAANQPPPEPVRPQAEVRNEPTNKPVVERLNKKVAEAAEKADEFRPDERRLGAVANPWAQQRLPEGHILDADVEISDPVVEQRFQDAKLNRRAPWNERLQEKLLGMGKTFTRQLTPLEPKRDAFTQDMFRQLQEVVPSSMEQAAQVITGFTAGMGPKRYQIYRRIVTLRDLAADVNAGKYEGTEIPFGFRDADHLNAELAGLEAKAQQLAPDVVDAVNRRKEYFDGLRDLMIEQGMLPEEARARTDYFHRQVLEYYNAKQDTIAEKSKSTYAKISAQKRRTYGSKDWNTDYLQSEFEVLSNVFAKLRSRELMDRMIGQADIRPQLELLAEQHNAANKGAGKEVTWRDMLRQYPEYTVLQKVPGNAVFKANTLAESVLDQYFAGLREIEPGDVRIVAAMGAKHHEFAIPKRVVEAMKQFRAESTSAKGIIDGMAMKTQQAWKVWTLLNPERVIKYNLNNLSGDADIVFAYNPKIFKYALGAAADLWNWHIRKRAATPEILEAHQFGLAKASFVAKELPDINTNELYRLIQNPEDVKAHKRFTGLLKKVFVNSFTDFTQWREDVLRLASYRHFKAELAEGKRPLGASRGVEMKQLYDAMDAGQMQPNEIAAKLARELVGDYGNISQSGQYIRSRLIPFYSWMEINAPRYVRLIKNMPHEEANLGKLGFVLGKNIVTKSGALMLKANAIMALANLYNRTVWPEEYAQLSDDQKRQQHIIVGKNPDTGLITTMRFQGALSDALEYFGGARTIDELQKAWAGKQSIGDALNEIPLGAFNKYAQGAMPFVKTAAEVGMGKSFYPDPLNPSPIRDRSRHVARLFNLGSVYDYVMDVPSKNKPIWEDLKRLIFYSTDPGESAYWAVRHKVWDHIEAITKERPNISPSAKSNALYFYKQALKYDPDLAKKYLDRYFELGGTTAGIKKSLAAADPLAGIKERDREMFIKAMTPEEQRLVDEAYKYYHSNLSIEKQK